MNMARGLANINISTVIPAESDKNRQTAPPMTFPTLSARRSPRYLPISTVTPMESPAIVKMIRFTILLPVETPEIPAVVPNQPTTRTSTAPYIACKIRAPSTGIINCTIFFIILPWVKSFLFSSILPTKPILSKCWHSLHPLPNRTRYLW